MTANDRTMVQGKEGMNGCKRFQKMLSYVLIIIS